MRDRPAGSNPFVGLRPFEADEDYLFFGRERETDELRKRLRTTRFIAVVGSSGSGKSSLVRSGLIPSLHGGLMAKAGSHWRIAIVQPGEDPIGNLVRTLDSVEMLKHPEQDVPASRALMEVTLRDSSVGIAEAVRHARLGDAENVLIVVDQFEELFRFRRSRASTNADDEAVSYVKLLLEASRGDAPVYVALTMRSEFMGECMRFPGLPEAISDGLYLIPRMTRDEMRRAITGPAAVAGGIIAPRLVVRVLNEASGENDVLPVLQHALMRTWQVWEADHGTGEPVDVRHYEATGTMVRALSDHADEAYSELTADEKRIAEVLFKSITDTSVEQGGVRNPMRLGRIAAIAGVGESQVADVIEHFRRPGRAFLRPAGAPLGPDSIIDISHESLIRLWSRLAAWTSEEARSRAVYRRLADSARLHAEGKESLWRNPQLAIALDWRRKNRPAEAWGGEGFRGAMKFLDRSRLAWRLRAAGAAAAILAVVGYLAWQVRETRLTNETLRGQRDSLSQQLTQARQLSAEEQREMDALQSDNERLRKESTALESTRAGLEKKIEEARAQGRELESKIRDLRAANEKLEDRMTRLVAEGNRLDAEFESQNDEVANLERATGSLAEVNRELQQESERLAARAESLAQMAELLGLHPEGQAATAGPSEFLRREVAARTAADIFLLPGEIAETRSLRGQIADLGRQLDQLRAERFLRADATGSLRRENQLLESQAAVLRQEIQRLQETTRGLEGRNNQLRAVLGQFQTQNQKLERDAQDLEKTVAGMRQRAEAVLKRLTSLRQIAMGNLQRLRSLHRRMADHRRTIEELSKPLTEFVTVSVKQDPRRSAELQALLAVRAFRFAPYDPDDPQTPGVYNALWRAMNRVDAAAARALIEPGAGEKGKIGVARSSEIAEGICKRVSRALTEQEWAENSPHWAPYSEEAARVCGGGPGLGAAGR